MRPSNDPAAAGEGAGTRLCRAVRKFNHKLIQPVQVILGSAQMLQMMPPDTPEARKRLEAILAQIERINTLNEELSGVLEECARELE